MITQPRWACLTRSPTDVIRSLYSHVESGPPVGAVARYDMATPGGGTTLADLSGRGHTATLVNGPEWIGSGVRLDGVNDFIDTQAERMGTMGLFAGPAERWTVSITARFTEQRSWARLMARAAHPGWQFMFYLDDALPSRRLWSEIRGASSGPLFTDDLGWHHHLIRWDGSVVQYRADGGTWVTLSVGTAAEQVGQRIILGSSNNGTEAFAPLDLAITHFWDRALTDGEADQDTQYARAVLAMRGITLGAGPLAPLHYLQDGRENRLLHSENLAHAVWSKVGVTTTEFAPLLHQARTWTVREDTSTGPHRLEQALPLAAFRDEDWSRWGLVVRRRGRVERVRVTQRARAGLWQSADFNLLDGTIVAEFGGGTGFIRPLPSFGSDTTYLVEVRGQHGTGGTIPEVHLELIHPTGAMSYLGDGVSGVDVALLRATRGPHRRAYARTSLRELVEPDTGLVDATTELIRDIQARWDGGGDCLDAEFRVGRRGFVPDIRPRDIWQLWTPGHLADEDAEVYRPRWAGVIALAPNQHDDSGRSQNVHAVGFSRRLEDTQTDNRPHPAGLELGARGPHVIRGRPVADVTMGAWTPTSGTTLWEALAAQDDASPRIRTATTDSDGEVRIAEIARAFPTQSTEVTAGRVRIIADTPGPDVERFPPRGLRFLFRARLVEFVGDATLQIWLVQGATVIAGLPATIPDGLSLSSSLIHYEVTLTRAQFDLITDFSDLRLRFRRRTGTATIEISYVRVDTAIPHLAGLYATEFAPPGIRGSDIAETGIANASAINPNYADLRQVLSALAEMARIGGRIIRWGVDGARRIFYRQPDLDRVARFDRATIDADFEWRTPRADDVVTRVRWLIAEGNAEGPFASGNAADNIDYSTPDYVTHQVDSGVTMYGVHSRLLPLPRDVAALRPLTFADLDAPSTDADIPIKLVLRSGNRLLASYDATGAIDTQIEATAAVATGVGVTVPVVALPAPVGRNEVLVFDAGAGQSPQLRVLHAAAAGATSLIGTLIGAAIAAGQRAYRLTRAVDGNPASYVTIRDEASANTQIRLSDLAIHFPAGLVTIATLIGFRITLKPVGTAGDGGAVGDGDWFQVFLWQVGMHRSLLRTRSSAAEFNQLVLAGDRARPSTAPINPNPPWILEVRLTRAVPSTGFGPQIAVEAFEPLVLDTRTLDALAQHEFKLPEPLTFHGSFRGEREQLALANVLPADAVTADSTLHDASQITWDASLGDMVDAHREVTEWALALDSATGVRTTIKVGERFEPDRAAEFARIRQRDTQATLDGRKGLTR